MLDRATQRKVDAYAKEMGAWMPPERKIRSDQHLSVVANDAPLVPGGGVAPFQADDALDYHRNAPQPEPVCLYGLVGDIARTGSRSSEANPYAIAAAAMVYLCSAIGRGPYLAIGDDWHHCRLFLAHVGRSGRGRKGSATKLVKRIAQEVARQSPHLAPQIHDGGLSSREGMVQLIHDPYKNGNDEVAGINDKRLLVIESEMANVLHQSMRSGNTLSAALRDCWDGVSIKPAVKSSLVWVTDPHVNLLANITPGELRELMSSRELSNGFANRFMFIWAEQSRIEPFPLATPHEVVEGLAQRVVEVLQFVGAERHGDREVMEVGFQQGSEAAKLYSHLYKTELRDSSGGERVAGLMERSAPMLLRLAMLFALTDQTTQIQVNHVQAAMAWIRYARASVQFIFQTAKDELQQEKVNEISDKVVAWLRMRHQATRTDLTRQCFKGHVAKGMLDQALDHLLTTTPPTIEVKELPRADNKPGAKTKRYQLAANSANSAKFVTDQGVRIPSPVEGQPRSLRNETDVTSQSDSSVRTVRTVRTESWTETSSQPIEMKHISPTSHSSHNGMPANGLANEDDGEMF